MRNNEVRRQFYDPTAQEALKSSHVESSPVVLEPRQLGPGEYRLRAAAGVILDRMFPREARRQPSKQSMRYKSMLNQIALGNFSIIDEFEKRKGGV